MMLKSILAYQNKLKKKALGLTSVTAAYDFFGVSGVTVSRPSGCGASGESRAEKAAQGVDTAVGPLHSVLGAKSAGTR